MFLRGELTAWIERIAQLRIYRWNKFRSLLERNFRSLGTDWDRQWLMNLKIAQMILVKVVLADVRAQSPQMLQAEMLEVMAETVMMTRKILRKKLMELNRVGCSPRGLDSLD